MKRQCPSCHQSISFLQWIRHNTLKWKVLCHHCQYRFSVIHNKPVKQQLLITLTVVVSVTLLKVAWNIFLFSMLGVLLKKIPVLDNLWQQNKDWILIAGLPIAIIMFRAMFLVSIYKNKKIH